MAFQQMSLAKEKAIVSEHFFMDFYKQPFAKREISLFLLDSFIATKMQIEVVEDVAEPYYDSLQNYSLGKESLSLWDPNANAVTVTKSKSNNATKKRGRNN
jgi:hypothetical protein